MNLTIQRTYCNCHPETCGCDPYELMLDGNKIANVYDPSGLTAVIKDIAAKDTEIDRLSTREDELNALCLDYQIDSDAARQEIARLKAILAPLLDHASAHDYAPPLKFSVQQCREIREKING